MYGKIFDSMYDGTLADDWRALITFQQMIVLCDADGTIDMTPASISRRTGIPIEHIKAGIQILENPDPYSRTPDEEGRRIRLLDEHKPWGWYIVNHNKYKSLQDSDTVREQNRQRKRRQRDKEKESRPVTVGHGPSRHTDTDTNTDTQKGAVPAILGLNVDAWIEWTAFRAKAKFKPYKTDETAKSLSRYSPEVQLLAVRHSIENQYQGLFPEKFNGGTNGKNQRSGEFKTPVQRVQETFAKLKSSGENLDGGGTGVR